MVPLPSIPGSPIIAPLFLWGGQTLFFPTMRLLVRTRRRKARYHEFFGLDEWLAAAFCRWPMPLTSKDKSGRRSDAAIKRAREHYQQDQAFPTVTRQLKSFKENGLDSKDLLGIVEKVIRYALMGRSWLFHKEYKHLGISKIDIILPDRPSLLRPLARRDKRQKAKAFYEPAADAWIELAFQARCHQSMLLSATAYWPEMNAAGELVPESVAKVLQSGKGVPKLGESDHLRFARAMVRLGESIPITRPRTTRSVFSCTPRWGPRSRAIELLSNRLRRIRFLCRLRRRKSRSPATTTLRRLLLGAKAQVQAVPLREPELPLITTA